MTFFPVPDNVVAPVTLPEGAREAAVLYTGTACLALMDVSATGEVWQDLLYDGGDHDHGSGGLMLNGASVGTHLEHDGEFPVEVVRDGDGFSVGFRVNLDPYAEDLEAVRDLDWRGGAAHGHASDLVHGHGHSHDHDGHSHGHGHSHEEGHETDGHGFVEGWSTVETVTLRSDRAVFGDPAGLPEADDTGGLLDLTFPSPGGTVALSVFTDSGLRRELVAVWSR